jgi:hypothetical protein
MALDRGPGHGGDALSKENGGDDGKLHFESVWWFWIVLIVIVMKMVS